MLNIKIFWVLLTKYYKCKSNFTFNYSIFSCRSCEASNEIALVINRQWNMLRHELSYISSELRNLDFDTSLVAKDDRVILAHLPLLVTSVVSWSQCQVDHPPACCGEFEIVSFVFFGEILKCARRSWFHETFAKQRMFLWFKANLQILYETVS